MCSPQRLRRRHRRRGDARAAPAPRPRPPSGPGPARPRSRRWPPDAPGAPGDPGAPQDGSGQGHARNAPERPQDPRTQPENTRNDSHSGQPFAGPSGPPGTPSRRPRPGWRGWPLLYICAAREPRSFTRPARPTSRPSGTPTPGSPPPTACAASAELAGRLERIAAQKARSKVKPGVGEVHGIGLGGLPDLARLLPSELVALRRRPLRLHLLARLLQARALVYAMTGPRAAGPRPDRGAARRERQHAGGRQGHLEQGRLPGAALHRHPPAPGLAPGRLQRRHHPRGHHRRRQGHAPPTSRQPSITAAQAAPTSTRRSCGPSSIIRTSPTMKQADVVIITDGEDELEPATIAARQGAHHGPRASAGSASASGRMLRPVCSRSPPSPPPWSASATPTTPSPSSPSSTWSETEHEPQLRGAGRGLPLHRRPVTAVAAVLRGWGMEVTGDCAVLRRQLPRGLGLLGQPAARRRPGRRGRARGASASAARLAHHLPLALGRRAALGRGVLLRPAHQSPAA